jgi:hypothetical protein
MDQPWLSKDMVSMPPDTLALEERREAQSLWDFTLGNPVVATFWFSDDELTDLKIIHC